MDDERWLDGLLAKHSLDAIRVLADLVEAGLFKGECSANDLKTRDFDQPNIIGGAFKLLRSVGFVSTDRIAKAQAGPRHAGLILVWELAERWRAEAFVKRARGLLLGVKPGQPAQQELMM